MKMHSVNIRPIHPPTHIHPLHWNRECKLAVGRYTYIPTVSKQVGNQSSYSDAQIVYAVVIPLPCSSPKLISQNIHNTRRHHRHLVIARRTWQREIKSKYRRRRERHISPCHPIQRSIWINGRSKRSASNWLHLNWTLKMLSQFFNIIALPSC